MNERSTAHKNALHCIKTVADYDLDEDKSLTDKQRQAAEGIMCDTWIKNVNSGADFGSAAVHAYHTFRRMQANNSEWENYHGKRTST